MTRVSEAVSQREQALFVGRHRELAAFRQWLLADTQFPELLSISGPGGVGKTTLLRAFRRIALELGTPVTIVDGRDIPATPRGLLAALTGSRRAVLEEVVARLNQSHPLVLIDTFEELSGLSAYLHDVLLPRLDTRVKIVVAGRHPPSLTWPRADSWLAMIRPLPLEGLSPRESLEY